MKRLFEPPTKGVKTHRLRAIGLRESTIQLGMLVHTFNPSTGETEAGQALVSFRTAWSL